jgi:hypothetical protein
MRMVITILVIKWLLCYHQCSVGNGKMKLRSHNRLDKTLWHRLPPWRSSNEPDKNGPDDSETDFREPLDGPSLDEDA